MAKNNDRLYFGKLGRPRKPEKPTPNRETVEQYLARGGKIQRVAPGAGKLSLAEIEQEDFEEALADVYTRFRSEK